jgi:hypothetical protein
LRITAVIGLAEPFKTPSFTSFLADKYNPPYQPSSYAHVPLVDRECISGIQFTMGVHPFCIVFTKSLPAGYKLDLQAPATVKTFSVEYKCEHLEGILTAITWSSSTPLILSGKFGRQQGTSNAPEGPFSVDNTALCVDKPPAAGAGSTNIIIIVSIVAVVVIVLVIVALW